MFQISKSHLLLYREIDHPNFVKILAFIESDNLDRSMMLILEQISCNSLAHIMYNQKERLNSLQICTILHQVVLGLQYLHDASIVHNYINAQSIYSLESKVVIGDLQYAQDIRLKRIPISSIVSQLPWMAPAQADGAIPDVASDIYRYTVKFILISFPCLISYYFSHITYFHNCLIA